jgi:hypothetical protein
MSSHLPPSPEIASKQLVREAQTINLQRPDGAFGRRHISRGLWGFYNPEKRREVAEVSMLVAVNEKLTPHGQFIGFKILKKRT